MACYVGQPLRPRLLELPPEIRLRIYDFVFAGSDIYVQLVGENLQDRHLRIHGIDIGIFLTSRQLHHETRSEWHTANIWTLGFPPALGFFLRSVSSEFLARIKHLTIQIHELPDLNTKLLPSLRLLVIDFTTDFPSFMTGTWYDYDDEKIYSRFADEAIDRVHSTFKVLITQLHAEMRAFQLGLLASDYYRPTRGLPVRKIELYVNLDTKLVERRTIEQAEVDNGSLYPEGKPIYVRELRAQNKLSASQALGPEHYLEDSRHLLDLRRCKFPPGRGGSFAEEDGDDRGSIRESEQVSFSDDSDDDADDDNDNDDDYEEFIGLAKGANWEDVKRIIENPSEDEQSTSKVESEDEGEVSESRRLKAEVDCQHRGLILGSQPIIHESEPEEFVSNNAFRGESTDAKVQTTAVYVEGD